MTNNQLNAFQAGSGFSVDWIHWLSQILFGGISIIIAVALIGQLIHLLGSHHHGVDEMSFSTHLMGSAIIVVLVLLIMS